MRQSFVFALSVALLASCATKEMDFQTPAPGDGEMVFHAYFEQPTSDTRVYATEDLFLRWHADDRVSIFNQNTFNQQYMFDGETGDNSGDFSIVGDSEATAGTAIPNVVSVYPYQPSTSISDSQVLTIDLPVKQAYAENTFGHGANTMVSVSSDNYLQYKNVGGYLMLKLYGEGISVSSITLRGNNEEKLAGKASVTMPLDAVPTVVMSDDATTQIILTCAEPVPLGATAEESTQFWFVVPPVTFSKGFTISVIDSMDGTFEMSTAKSITVGRNNLSRMSPMEVTPGYGFVPFEDEWFKAYCLYWFDMNDDGKLSFEEAKDATEIKVYNNQIFSLRGIEYFTNLTTLRCGSNQLADIDLSQNTVLKSLDCSNNQLTSLDLSHNPALSFLACGDNQLTSLDVSNNPALTYLSCDRNQLTSLDVSNNPALIELQCVENQLTSLDVSKNSALKYLVCFNNQLSNLDISNNPRLTYLACEDNQLANLDVSANPEISYLNCARNQLTSLDVSNLKVLSILCCFDNELTSLDVTNNVKLENFDCGKNRLTSLDVSKNVLLIWLYCENNLFTSLDVSYNTKLEHLWCPANPYLTEIWLQMGQTIEDLEYDRDIATIKYKPEAVDLGLSVKWASFNVGASAPEEYGDYFAWGETEPKEEYSYATYKWCKGDLQSLTKYCNNSSFGYNGFTDDKTVLDLEDDAAYVNYGGNWRMPTDAEWTELTDNCTWTWTTRNGVNGRLVTASNGNSIFLPAGGSWNNTVFSGEGIVGWYWSSSYFDRARAWSKDMDSRSINGDDSSRHEGYSIRPVYAE